MLTLSRQYIELKYDIKQIFSKLENIERLLNVAVTTGSNSYINVLDGEKSFLDELSLTSVAKVTEFDSTISESPEKFNSLVCILKNPHRRRCITAFL